MKNNKTRAFLKWAGGKYSLTEQISDLLPEANKLFEPFVGAGSVFLNSNFEHYHLNDINPDLIELYKILKRRPQQYIRDARKLFIAKNNADYISMSPSDNFLTRKQEEKETQLSAGLISNSLIVISITHMMY